MRRLRKSHLIGLFFLTAIFGLWQNCGQTGFESPSHNPGFENSGDPTPAPAPSPSPSTSGLPANPDFGSMNHCLNNDLTTLQITDTSFYTPQANKGYIVKISSAGQAHGTKGVIAAAFDGDAFTVIVSETPCDYVGAANAGSFEFANISSTAYLMAVDPSQPKPKLQFGEKYIFLDNTKSYYLHYIHAYIDMKAAAAQFPGVNPLDIKPLALKNRLLAQSSRSYYFRINGLTWQK